MDDKPSDTDTQQEWVYYYHGLKWWIEGVAIWLARILPPGLVWCMGMRLWAWNVASRRPSDQLKVVLNAYRTAHVRRHVRPYGVYAWLAKHAAPQLIFHATDRILSFGGQQGLDTHELVEAWSDYLIEVVK